MSTACWVCGRDATGLKVLRVLSVNEERFACSARCQTTALENWPMKKMGLPNYHRVPRTKTEAEALGDAVAAAGAALGGTGKTDFRQMTREEFETAIAHAIYAFTSGVAKRSSEEAPF